MEIDHRDRVFWWKSGDILSCVEFLDSRIGQEGEWDVGFRLGEVDDDAGKS